MIYSNVFSGIMLPERLTDLEFKIYYNKFKNGDLEARNILINHNIRLVLTVIQKKFNNDKYDTEELLSSGIIGLIMAVDTYDIEKNDKFSGYASKCIKSEIIKYLIKIDKHLEYDVISLDTPVIFDDDVVLLEERITDDNDLEINLVEREIKKIEFELIRKTLSTLNDREKEIISMYYGFKDGILYKQREIAEVLNISRARVAKIISDTLLKIKKRILFEQKYMEYTKGYTLEKRRFN